MISALETMHPASSFPRNASPFLHGLALLDIPPYMGAASPRNAAKPQSIGIKKKRQKREFFFGLVGSWRPGPRFFFSFLKKVTM